MSKKVHFLTMFFLCLCAATRPVQAQERSETAYMFRFVAGSDMFYVPWSGNGSQLDSLLSALSANMEPLRGGERYISVSSYGATSGDARTAARMAYLRCSRVKSELITRGGVTESMFLTDRHIGAPYEGVERNVVVVTFPASVEKVAELAGAEAAARVAAYNRGTSDEQERERMAAEKKAEEERIARESRGGAPCNGAGGPQKSGSRETDRAGAGACKRTRTRTRTEDGSGESDTEDRPPLYVRRADEPAVRRLRRTDLGSGVENRPQCGH